MKLIEGCWSYNPTERKSLDEILSTLLRIEQMGIPGSLQNDNFKLVSVDPQSPEFERLRESFNASMQQHHFDYVIARIKGGLDPVSTFIMIVVKISFFHSNRLRSVYYRLSE